MNLLTGTGLSIDQRIREATVTLINEVEKFHSWLPSLVLGIVLQAVASIELFSVIVNIVGNITEITAGAVKIRSSCAHM